MKEKETKIARAIRTEVNKNREGESLPLGG